MGRVRTKTEEIATISNRAILLSNDIGFPHQQKGPRSSRIYILQETPKQNRRVLDPPYETDSEGSNSWYPT